MTARDPAAAPVDYAGEALPDLVAFDYRNSRKWKPGSRWTRLCWWLSRKLGGRRVFGKRDLT